MSLLPGSRGQAQATGTLTGVVIAERENPEGGASLLFGSGEAPGALADAVRLSLPRQLRSPRAGLLPPDWACTPTEKAWTCQGPPTPTPVRIRFDYLSGSVKKLDYEVLLSGRTIASRRGVAVQKLPPIAIQSSLEGVLQLPPEVYPGQRLDLRLLDPAKLPLDATLGFGGTWTIGGKKPYTEVGSAPGQPEWRLIIPDLDAGQALSFEFRDLWGMKRLAVPDATGPNVKVVESPSPLLDERLFGIEHALLPVLTDATPRVFPGDVACVRGYFPPGAFGGLWLNGQPLGPPVTASDTVLWFRIPPATPPGPIEITGDPDAGFRPGDAVRTVVIQVGGSIDRSKLLRGESTTLRLWLEGTDQPTALVLRNHTPGIIRIEGGDEQTVTTSGGSPNEVVLKVDAVTPGDFHVTYSLDGAQCPPAEAEDILSEIGGPEPTGPRVAGTASMPPSPPPDAKPPSNEQEEKKPDSCGPDVTDALVEALNRIHERTKGLGIDERGIAGARSFWGRHYDVDADVKAMAEGRRHPRYEGSGACSGRTQSELCARTMSIGSLCVLAREFDYLGTLVAQRLLAEVDLPVTHPSSPYALANLLGERLEQGPPLTGLALQTILASARKPDSPLDSVVPMSFFLTMGWCEPCAERATVPAEFDFSKIDWKLASGGTAPGQR